MNQEHAQKLSKEVEAMLALFIQSPLLGELLVAELELVRSKLEDIQKLANGSDTADTSLDKDTSDRLDNINVVSDVPPDAPAPVDSTPAAPVDVPPPVDPAAPVQDPTSAPTPAPIVAPDAPAPVDVPPDPSQPTPSV